jgi:hypothetical protein
MLIQVHPGDLLFMSLHFWNEVKKLLFCGEKMDERSVMGFLNSLPSLHGPTVKKHLSRDYVGLIGLDER